MNMRKIWQIAKAGMENFSVAAGAVAVVFSLVLVVAPVSLVVSLAVTIGVGIAFGVVGAYQGFKKMQQKEQQQNTLELQQNALEFQRQEMKKEQQVLLDIAKDINQKIAHLERLEAEQQEAKQRESALQQSLQEELPERMRSPRRHRHSRVYMQNSQTFFVITARPELTETLSVPTVHPGAVSHSVA